MWCCWIFPDRDPASTQRLVVLFEFITRTLAHEASGTLILRLGSSPALDRPVVLFDDVVQRLSLTDLERGFTLSVDGFKGCQIGPALVDRHRLGHPIVSYRFFEITPRCKRVAPGAKLEINCVAVLVQGTIDTSIAL
jgi:hypothetical protein